MSARIIVIDDDVTFATYVRAALGRYGHRVTAFESARDGVWAVASTAPDLVILDVMMPEMNGWEVCQRLRVISDVPILMCTALGYGLNAAKGLSLGADDYVTKACLPQELHARVKALLRRAALMRAVPVPPLFVVDDALHLDLERKMAWLGGQTVKLSPLEFQLLAYMAHSQGQTAAYDELWSHVWDYAGVPDKGLIQRTVSNLRRKVGKERITSVRGHGYCLN
ncbi:MAG: response regulator transcription factor [Chloroflexi bacterium]|nr:response regulator transcription factor [Chloroflexota bacterium]